MDAKLEARMASVWEVVSSRHAVEATDLSLIQNVTRALAAMHERVEQQHAELTRWHRQNYKLMCTMVVHVNWREEDHRQLRDELVNVRQQLGRVAVRGDVPLLRPRNGG
ncbi:hypothetical protein LMJF_35_4680 [Leishmania major strain Friedlin]|uniref:Uncharacterized protein n=1 Tax=Leishmania major TaxID=5664 RepID=E9AFU5_LEIMA|nr:hypothetical protein LMJF_35_4680 [Leishmania major strain Friedlin]CAG9582826.1 hypothetical_protein_-_conserved [Leishmania major strain Friedlin]CBZ13099.1 hypothetical protein LMJF_35_4680 [Leishmania major strain Friedlin]|eukprot:XP_003722865.1 hypothetical protein LMJF_35_4680 [Leishmania major strain Friedlin]